MMDTRDEFTFGDLALQATVRRRGGELVSLRSHGREVLWSGDAPWRRQSPVLFPIVGKLAGDTAHIDGRDYRIGQHGFARDMDFAWLECRDAECQLELRDTEETRAMFPYAFRLVIGYHVVHGELIVRYRLVNPDPVRRLHASLGAHPAFIWPLAPDVPRDGHFIEFERNEMSPIGRVEDGLLSPKRVSNPVSGKHLALSDALFAHDALIFDHVQSSGLTYRGGGYGLTIRWEHFRQLGIWTKPGAGFLCIEPWHGFSSPAGFDGPFEEKPGLLHLAPGHSWEASWSVQSRDRSRG